MKENGIKNTCGYIYAPLEWYIYYHLGLKFKVDNNLNPKKIKEAAFKTLRHFDFLKTKLCYKNKQCYIYTNNKPFLIHNTKKYVRPCSRLNNLYPISFNYNKDSITICISHVLTDGNILLKIGNYFINTYWRLCFKNYKSNFFEKKEYHAIDYYDLDFKSSDIKMKNNNREIDVSKIKSVDNNFWKFIITKKLVVTRFEIDAESFTNAFKENSSHYSDYFIYIINKSFAKLKLINEENDSIVAATVLINGRKQLGMEDTYLNCVFESVVSNNTNSLLNDSKDKLLNDIHKQKESIYSKENIWSEAYRRVQHKRSYNRTYVFNNMGDLGFLNDTTANVEAEFLDYTINKVTVYTINNKCVMQICLPKEVRDSFTEHFKETLKEEKIQLIKVYNFAPNKERGIKNNFSMLYNRFK